MKKIRNGIAIMLTVLLAFLLFSCAGNTDRAKNGVKITATDAKTEQTEEYNDAVFSMTIPKGWKVTYGGSDIYHSIRISDPDEPLNCMFVLLKADCLLHSQEGKDAWKAVYNEGNRDAVIFANAPVLEKPSPESFFKIFAQYADMASKFEAAYVGYSFPHYDNFTVTDRFSASGDMVKYSLGDEFLRATFTDNGRAGEGMFSASVVDFKESLYSDRTVADYGLESVDSGYYMAYNIVAITAAKDTFIEWEDLLTECLKTLKYSDIFENNIRGAIERDFFQARCINQNFNQTMDGIMSSWDSRNKSIDIISQKQSDATLGYERVYDTRTKEIYRAAKGFTSSYKGKGYKPVTDDNMYTTPISGYIEKD